MQISLSNDTQFELTSAKDIPFLEAQVNIEEEKFLVEFLKKWFSEDQWFEFQTSGSTGTPKSIRLHRDTLLYSARQTLQALELDKGQQSNYRFLLCISPRFIGGIMVFIRAWLCKGYLKIIPANTNFRFLQSPFDLTSIVPLQAEKLLQSPLSLSKLTKVLIGGAPISPGLEEKLGQSLNKSQQWFATYGMTETASHVALKEVGTTVFHATGDAQFSLDNRDCLQIIGTITNKKTLATNDVVDLIDPQRFRWKGRFDFIINSGGVKINPERVESKLNETLGIKQPIITWIPDDQLGQKVVCLTTEAFDQSQLLVSSLHPYEQPKHIAIVNSIPLKPNGKIDRKAAQQLAMTLLN